ncbi:MAG TPA: hypothetical protein VGP46_06665 [Acidimicrobiales bacterium]|nr:hypothetical protein [Acidimicrobiales bacterium]
MYKFGMTDFSLVPDGPSPETMPAPTALARVVLLTCLWILVAAVAVTLLLWGGLTLLTLARHAPPAGGGG